MEIWKDIKDYEGIYQVSNLGNVKSLDREKWDSWNTSFSSIKGINLKKSKKQKGYVVVGLSKNNIEKKKSIHRLVAIHFIPNPLNLPQVNHKYPLLGKDFNEWWNLEWCTNSENQKHAYKNGLNISIKGSKRWNSKLTEKEVLEIRKSKLTQQKLADIYGVNRTLISHIKLRRTWKHI